MGPVRDLLAGMATSAGTICEKSPPARHRDVNEVVRVDQSVAQLAMRVLRDEDVRVLPPHNVLARKQKGLPQTFRSEEVHLPREWNPCSRSAWSARRRECSERIGAPYLFMAVGFQSQEEANQTTHLAWIQCAREDGLERR